MLVQYLWAKLLKKARGVEIVESTIDESSKVEAGSYIENTTFDKYSFCGYDCKIVNSDIGSFSSIACGVIIGGVSSLKKAECSLYQKENREKNARCFIGNDVWIGDNVIVKEGVSIGHGAVIGMGSVVTENVPPYEVWAGNPAKFIKNRFTDDIIEKLLIIEWWNLQDSDLHKAAVYIKEPLKFIKVCKKLTVKI